MNCAGYAGSLHQGGEYLTKTLGNKLKADVLHAPHHAAESAAPNALLQAVNPSHAIVSSFTDLWCSKRSERMRSFFEKAGVQTRVLGVQGHVMVRHFRDTEPVWVEDRSKNINCEAHWNSFFSEPITEQHFLANNDNILYAIDSVKTVEIGDFPATRLTGWSFLKSSASNEVSLGIGLLHLDSASLQIFHPTRYKRLDVENVHRQFKGQAKNSGFQLTLSNKSLKNGRYAVLFMHSTNGQTVTTRSTKELVITNGASNLD